MALEIVKVQTVWWENGEARQIGSSFGAAAHIIERCLKRMCGWVCLAACTVETEYPSFDIMNAFAIFNLVGSIDEAPS